MSDQDREYHMRVMMPEGEVKLHLVDYAKYAALREENEALKSGAMPVETFKELKKQLQTEREKTDDVKVKYMKLRDEMQEKVTKLEEELNHTLKEASLLETKYQKAWPTIEKLRSAIIKAKRMNDNIFEKGNVNWGATFVKWDIINEALLAVDEAARSPSARVEGKK